MVVRRVMVAGASMAPTLVEGDRLLVLPARLRVGDVVAVRDPRDPRRVMVKRLASIGPDGCTVVGDNPPASTDSRSFGPVPHHLLLGRCVYRYSPAHRRGRL